MANEKARISFICGLKSEADCLTDLEPGAKIGVSGASAERAYQIAQTFAKDGASALISFGVSGALTSTLRPGALVYAESVVGSNAQEWPTDAKWRTAAAEAASSLQLPIVPGRLVGSDRIIDTLQAKRELGIQTQAVAVDMETHEVARAAAEHGTPFFALRAIADADDQIIPAVALNSVAEDGSVRVVSVLSRLVFRPQDVPALIRLGQHNAKATSALRRSALEFLPLLFRRMDLD